jgi:hypothetical protein
VPTAPPTDRANNSNANSSKQELRQQKMTANNDHQTTQTKKTQMTATGQMTTNATQNTSLSLSLAKSSKDQTVTMCG